jgi:hypothetical protein
MVIQQTMAKKFLLLLPRFCFHSAANRGDFFNTHAWLRKLSANSKRRGRAFSCYCSFAYSALASFSMGMSGSASFQRLRGNPCRRRAHGRGRHLHLLRPLPVRVPLKDIGASHSHMVQFCQNSLPALVVELGQGRYSSWSILRCNSRSIDSVCCSSAPDGRVFRLFRFHHCQQ